MSRFLLGLIAIIKNEAMVMEEFLEHYRWQGVQKAYVIDNGSSDDTRRVLEPFVASGFVELVDMPEPHLQVHHYNTLYQRIRSQCAWIVIVDADEFMYSRAKGSTLTTYLGSIDRDVIVGVYVHWKMFGSCGYKTQPRGRIRASFVKRRQQLDTVQQKAIVNTKFTLKLHIHSHFHALESGRYVIVDPPELALNHYPVMSVEYFTTVKVPRGDVLDPEHDRTRDLEYFERYDFDEVLDDELKRLVEREQRSVVVFARLDGPFSNRRCFIDTFPKNCCQTCWST